MGEQLRGATMHGKATAETVKVRIAEAENAVAACEDLTEDQRAVALCSLSAAFSAVTRAAQANREAQR